MGRARRRDAACASIPRLVAFDHTLELGHRGRRIVRRRRDMRRIGQRQEFGIDQIVVLLGLRLERRGRRCEPLGAIGGIAVPVVDSRIAWMRLLPSATNVARTVSASSGRWTASTLRVTRSPCLLRTNIQIQKFYLQKV